MGFDASSLFLKLLFSPAVEEVMVRLNSLAYACTGHCNVQDQVNGQLHEPLYK